jgi:hypothetical protein
MTRTLLLLGLITLLSGGCGSSGNNNTGGNGGGTGSDGVDMSAASSSTDLAASGPIDMSPAYGCHALAACLDACTDQASCTLCIQSATTMARSLYNTVSKCVRRTCFPHPDGGPAPCTQGGGTQPPECTTCQDDSIKMTGSCGADTLYCGACYSAYATCEANTP